MDFFRDTDFGAVIVLVLRFFGLPTFLVIFLVAILWARGWYEGLTGIYRGASSLGEYLGRGVRWGAANGLLTVMVVAIGVALTVGAVRGYTWLQEREARQALLAAPQDACGNPVSVYEEDHGSTVRWSYGIAEPCRSIAIWKGADKVDELQFESTLNRIGGREGVDVYAVGDSRLVGVGTDHHADLSVQWSLPRRTLCGEWDQYRGIFFQKCSVANQVFARAAQDRIYVVNKSAIIQNISDIGGFSIGGTRQVLSLVGVNYKTGEVTATVWKCKRGTLVWVDNWASPTSAPNAYCSAGTDDRAHIEKLPK